MIEQPETPEREEIQDEWDLIFEEVRNEQKDIKPACPIDPKERANCVWCEG